MEFNPNTDIPSLTGKVIIVTGGTDGLGKESIRQLALHSPACVYLTARNPEKANRVLAEFKQEYPDHAPIALLNMDLDSLASVRAAAKAFLAENDRLDILICNAGYLGASALTQDGYEKCFGVNHLAHALFIQLLLPVLRKTAAQPGSDVRVVTVSSMAERFSPKNYTLEKMKTDLSQLGLMTRYGQSKLANIQYSSTLAKKNPEILFTSLHPGNVRTNIQQGFLERVNKTVRSLLLKLGPIFMTVVNVEEGAKGQLWCATGKRDTIENGAFYWPVGLLGKGSTKTRDTKMAESLWVWTEKQLGRYLDVEKDLLSSEVSDLRNLDMKAMDTVAATIHEVRV